MRLGISLSTLYNSYFLSKWIVSITIRWAAMRLPNRIVSLLLPQDRLAPVASKYFSKASFIMKYPLSVLAQRISASFAYSLNCSIISLSIGPLFLDIILLPQLAYFFRMGCFISIYHIHIVYKFSSFWL